MICPPRGHVYRVAQDAMGVGSGKMLASWRIRTNHARDAKVTGVTSSYIAM